MIEFGGHTEFSEAELGARKQKDVTSARLLEKLHTVLRGHHSSVLPVDLEEKRQLSRVLPVLPVSTHAALNMAHTIKAHLGRDVKSVFDQLVTPFALHEERLGEGNRLLYVDKMRPHGKFDLMVTQSETEIRPRFEDLGCSARNRIVSNISIFMNYCRDRGLTAVCSYSVDPETLDRKSAQSSKRFHVHFVAREPWEVAVVETESQPLGALKDSFAQRRLVDETAVVLGHALADRIEAGPLVDCFAIQRPLSTEQNFPFLRLFRDQPRDLQDISAFATQLTAIHALYESVYQELREVFFFGTSDKWQRARILPDHEQLINQLDASTTGVTRDLIAHCAKAFSKRILDMVEAVRPGDELRALVSHVYPNAGAAYSVTLTDHDPGQIGMVFRPFLFSDTGGAGLSSISDVVIKTKKRDDVPLSPMPLPRGSK